MRNESVAECGVRQRDPALRERYLQLALAQIPRLLGAVDRNPYHATYGCFDRQYWHYRTASFASEMYQEAVLPLALVYATPLPGNRWHGEPRLRELAIAALRFAARNSHRDGSCDDYYPYERALGAAVFSLQAATRAYQLLELNDGELLAWFKRRARWIIEHDESGRLANHHALAALGLFRVSQITGHECCRQAADERVRKVLAWQSPEGWFEEYGGADPGYQTVTIDALAKLRRLSSDARLDEPLRRAVAFAHLFLHADGSYAGEYGSRGTYHFYPDGFELLAAENRQAAELADGFLHGIDEGKVAAFDDDRMYAHRLASLIEAYLDWSPTTAAPALEAGSPVVPALVAGTPVAPALVAGHKAQTAGHEGQGDRNRAAMMNLAGSHGFCYLPHAGILVHRTVEASTVVSTARGGIFKHCCAGRPLQTDTGLIIETADGRQAVSQHHDREREITWHCQEPAPSDDRARSSSTAGTLTVVSQLRWTRHETATPLKQAIFHLAMISLGRWGRGLVRRLLQRRLIAPRSACPVRLTRRFEFIGDGAKKTVACRVTDHIELLDSRLVVRRMSFTSDLQAAYTAAAHIYQESVLEPWTDLAAQLDELNQRRRITIVRWLGQSRTPIRPSDRR